MAHNPVQAQAGKQWQGKPKLRGYVVVDGKKVSATRVTTKLKAAQEGETAPMMELEVVPW